MTEYMPVMLRLSRFRCLVVGGGKVALRKALTLLRYQIEVTVVSKELEYGLEKLVRRGLIRWKQKRFAPPDLWGHQLVVAATDNRRQNRRICFWAKLFRILSNSVDDPHVSDFIFPASHQSGPLVIAVSTQGGCPALTRKIKRDLAQEYGAAYGDYVRKLAAFREHLKILVPDYSERRKILTRLVRLPHTRVTAWENSDFEEWLHHEYGK